MCSTHPEHPQLYSTGTEQFTIAPREIIIIPDRLGVQAQAVAGSLIGTDFFSFGMHAVILFSHCVRPCDVFYIDRGAHGHKPCDDVCYIDRDAQCDDVVSHGLTDMI